MSVKYYNKDDNYLSVESQGKGGDGEVFAVYLHEDGEEIKMERFEPTTDKNELENALEKFAVDSEGQLLPELLWKIKKGERVLQGSTKKVDDYIKVSPVDMAEAFEEYIATETQINAYEAEKKEEIESVKSEFKEKIEAEEEKMNVLKKIARTGTRKETCTASEERDIENGMIYLVRHDNLKILHSRKMEDHELQAQTNDIPVENDEPAKEESTPAETENEVLDDDFTETPSEEVDQEESI